MIIWGRCPAFLGAAIAITLLSFNSLLSFYPLFFGLLVLFALFLFDCGSPPGEVPIHRSSSGDSPSYNEDSRSDCLAKRSRPISRGGGTRYENRRCEDFPFWTRNSVGGPV